MDKQKVKPSSAKDKASERNEPYQRFEDFLSRLAQVPKEEVDEKRAEYERKREKRAG